MHRREGFPLSHPSSGLKSVLVRLGVDAEALKA